MNKEIYIVEVSTITQSDSGPNHRYVSSRGVYTSRTAMFKAVCEFATSRSYLTLEGDGDEPNKKHNVFALVDDTGFCNYIIDVKPTRSNAAL